MELIPYRLFIYYAHVYKNGALVFIPTFSLKTVINTHFLKRSFLLCSSALHRLIFALQKLLKNGAANHSQKRASAEATKAKAVSEKPLKE